MTCVWICPRKSKLHACLLWEGQSAVPCRPLYESPKPPKRNCCSEQSHVMHDAPTRAGWGAGSTGAQESSQSHLVTGAGGWPARSRRASVLLPGLLPGAPAHVRPPGHGSSLWPSATCDVGPGLCAQATQDAPRRSGHSELLPLPSSATCLASVPGKLWLREAPRALRRVTCWSETWVPPGSAGRESGARLTTTMAPSSFPVPPAGSPPPSLAPTCLFTGPASRLGPRTHLVSSLGPLLTPPCHTGWPAVTCC